MPRQQQPDRRVMYRVTDPFTVFKDGVPVVYAGEVMEDDPILKTHRHHFELAADQVLKRNRVEQATAAPGELRALEVPADTKEEKSDG